MKLVCRVVLVLLCLIVSQQAGIAQSAIITSHAVNGTEGYLLESQLDPVSFPRADFDGDGRSDIVWHHTYGYSAIWLMNEPTGGDLRGAGTGWSVKTVGDFDGDRKSDLVWQHTDGSIEIWLMNGLGARIGGNVLGAGTGWIVKGVGDFEGNGKSDTVWQHTDGSVAICLMDGLTASCHYVLEAGTGWSVRTLGDFEGNGKSDIVWQHTDGSTAIWWMDGLTGSGEHLLGPGTGWSVKALGDFDGDGKSDLLWQHTDGSCVIWLMTEPRIGGGLLGAGTGWSVKALGDFDGDGKSDIVWHHTDGNVAIWLMNGVAPSVGGDMLGAGSGWSVQDVGDFDGDSKSDIVWRHADEAVVLWLMNALSVTGGGVLKEAGTGWVPGLLPIPGGASPPPPPPPPPPPSPQPPPPPPPPQENTGIASRYPGDVGIGSDPDVIFADDFEGYAQSADLSNRWDNVFQKHLVEITTDAANVFRGSKALQFTLPKQAEGLGNATEKVVNPEQDVLFLRFYSKIQPPYDVAGSIHDGASIAAHYTGPGVPANGTNNFLASLENGRYDSATPSPGHLNIYLYHPEQRDVYGDHFYPNGDVSPNTSLKFNYGPGFVSRPNIMIQLDRWYCYEFMVQANTPGQRDGRIAIWVDGALVADFLGLRLRDVDTLKIDRFALSLFLGTNPNGPALKWYDNVVAAKSYIGPIAP